jgi:hypothetical protein
MTPDGQLVGLAVADWMDVKAALGQLFHDRPPAKTSRLPEHHGEPWSADLDKQLRLLWEQDRPVSELARTLGRTRGSIKSRLEKLGILAE